MFPLICTRRKNSRAAHKRARLLQIVYKRISQVRFSINLLAVAVVAVAIFLFGGGLYDLTMKPYPAVYYGGRFLFVYPQLSEQFISESIVAMALYSLGVIGTALVYESTRYAFKPRQAYLMFLAGSFLLIVAYASLEAVMHYWKGV